MRRLFDVFDGILLLLGIAPNVGQIHFAERASANFAFHDERLAQFSERLVPQGALCKVSKRKLVVTQPNKIRLRTRRGHLFRRTRNVAAAAAAAGCDLGFCVCHCRSMRCNARF